MKLNAWLKQDRPLSDRLQLVEHLAQALNEVHDRGEALAALEPERIEVDDEGRCDLGPARRGAPTASYCAPERAEGGGPSVEADIYTAGAIAWEVLAGRQYSASPSHLAEAAPSAPRELADAIMACLEQSPQWRPRDLTYVAQLAQHAQGQRTRGAERGAARSSASPRKGPARTAARREPQGSAGQTSHLLIAGVTAVVVAAAAGGYYLWTRPGTSAPSTPPQTRALAPAARTAAAQPPPTPLAAAQSAPATRPPSAAPTSTPLPAPTTTTLPASVLLPPPTAPPTAPPTTRPPVQPAPPPATAPVTQRPFTAAPPTLPAAPATTLAPMTTTTTTTTLVALPASVEPPVLSAVSPLSVRRPGKIVLDLRGSGLRSDLRARVLPVRDVPRGITVLRQAWKGPGLVQVLIELDPTVAPGTYAIALQDAAGGQTKPLTFTVTK